MSLPVLLSCLQRLAAVLLVAALLSACASTLPGEGIASAAILANQLSDMEETLNIRIRDATQQGDFLVEKAGRELRIALKSLEYQLDRQRTGLFGQVDDTQQQMALQLRQEVDRLDELAGQVLDVQDFAYLNLQNLANRLLPNLYIITSLEGFSQEYREDGLYSFRVLGNPIQVGNIVSVEVNGKPVHEGGIRITRANELRFTVPADVLNGSFKESEVARVPFAISVQRKKSSRWYRPDPEWKTIYEYEDEEGVLLLPKYPVRYAVEEVFLEPRVDRSKVETLTATTRVPASGKACGNDYSCDRSCVVCEEICIDLPEGAELVNAKAKKISDNQWAHVKSHSIDTSDPRLLCARVANWKKSGGARFSYTVSFHPPTQVALTRAASAKPTRASSQELADRAEKGLLAFNEPYEIVFDPQAFRSYTLRLEVFNGEKIVLTKGATHRGVWQAPDFGGPLFKRLIFTVQPARL